MKFYRVLLGVMIFVLLVAIPAYAQDQAAGQSEVTRFNRDLVDKVEKGCIYIWIMTAEYGFMYQGGIGSGVIFMAVPEENAAYALTNHHVGRDSAILQVETWDHATYRAQLVATEPGIDCSLIRIENIPRDRYEPCVLGNSDEVRLGDLGLAIGAPGYDSAENTERSDPKITWGLHQTATLKVVSGRSTNPYELIQTWAAWKDVQGRQVMTNLPWRFMMESAISPGNSGGPLFNSRGEIIGLNHAHLGSGPEITQHQNYSIPINFCMNFAFQVLDTGKYELPWFGIDLLMPRYIEDPMIVREFLEEFLDVKKLIVFGIRPDSPASRSGLQENDIIIEFDGRVFSDITELRLYIFGLEIGQQVPIVVKRGKREVELILETVPKRSYDSEFSL